MKTPHSISAVVPVYHGEATLVPLVERLRTVLRQCSKSFEIILVNDDSPDQSWKVMGELAAKYSEVTAIRLSRNFGQHNALLAGIRAAKYDLIITLDDDLQNPPEEIPKLLTGIESGYDVVYGEPINKQHSAWRNLASLLTRLTLNTVMGLKAARHVSAFRAFRTPLREGFADYQSPFICLDVLLSWSTSRFGFVAVQHDERKMGRSNYRPWKLIVHALNMITGYTALPLRFASIMGFFLVGFGIAVFGFVLARYFVSGSRVAGFPFLASIISIFSGSQLFALGVIGEYLGRMHFRMMDRPSYLIKEVITNM